MKANRVGMNAGFTLLGMNRTIVSIDFTSATWNTVASHEVFTVTGMVLVTVFWRCTEDLASGGAGEIQFGREGATNEYTATQVITGIDAGEFIEPGVATGGVTNAESGAFINSATTDAMMFLDGLDIGYEVSVAALTDGTIQGICFWTPISADGLVVAGAGGVL